MQLQKTMEEMLEKSGVNDADTEIKGPTQVRISIKKMKHSETPKNEKFWHSKKFLELS